MLAIIRSKIFCLPVPKTLKIKIHKSVILPAVLYGCETWSLTLSQEHRLRDFEKSVERIFVPETEEDGSWRKLRNDELHSLYSSPNIVIVHTSCNGLAERRGYKTQNNSNNSIINALLRRLIPYLTHIKH
jgi:hypothetical protein